MGFLVLALLGMRKQTQTFTESKERIKHIKIDTPPRLKLHRPPRPQKLNGENKPTEVVTLVKNRVNVLVFPCLMITLDRHSSFW